MLNTLIYKKCYIYKLFFKWQCPNNNKDFGYCHLWGDQGHTHTHFYLYHWHTHAVTHSSSHPDDACHS